MRLTTTLIVLAISRLTLPTSTHDCSIVSFNACSLRGYSFSSIWRCRPLPPSLLPYCSRNSKTKTNAKNANQILSQVTGLRSGSDDAERTCATVDCAIIGAGPAGLATAIAISKASPSSTIGLFEKDEFQPKGASISISKNGWKSLEDLDQKGKVGKKNVGWSLVKQLKRTGTTIVAGFEFRPWKREKRKEEDTTPLKMITKIGMTVKKYVWKGFLKYFPPLLWKLGIVGPSLQVYLWHDVRMTLRQHAKDVYDSNEHEHTAVSFFNANCYLESIRPIMRNNETKTRFELTFRESGVNTSTTTTVHKVVKIKAKYVFACDGTRSQVRSLLPSEKDILVAENKSVWRGIAPNVSTGRKPIFYQGSSSTAAIFPSGKNRGSSWTVISDAEPGRSTTDEEARRRVLNVIRSMGNDDDDDDTMKKGEDGEEQRHLMKRAIDDSPIIIENKLYVRDFSLPWESSIDGLVYIGDSAHPVRPTGQGMALAFEDASVLHKVVKERGLGVDALRQYERERYEPVKQVSDRERERANSFYK